jgi:CMP-N-acetylneuraminic acid synthetase/regulator of RNase E activity RraA
MKVVAFLPVKGKSNRIENKNIKLLDGKPLFLHTLEKLIKCDFIDEVYLDSESDEIFELASEVNCRSFKREEKYASNKTDGNVLFMNEVKHTPGDIYIQILCTSPFIEIKTIRKGVELLKTDHSYDSVVLIRREKFYTWDSQTLHPHYDMEHIPNSYTLDDTIVETMGLYIIRKEAAFATERRIGDHPYLLEAKPIEAVDVNYPEDFALAELIAAGKREKERKLLANLSQKLTSSMISDVLDEMGIHDKVLLGLTSNFLNKKLFGRAKTLRLKERTANDSTTIYDALNSYMTIIPGDIIAVENELPQFAYFGELNASLAMRSGAIGAIIGGKTRDSTEVKKFDFPVFSRGYSCQDIKDKGTLDYINKKIKINGVEIGYEDLIFADNDGIVVIPKVYEEKVLEKCFQVSKKENNILIDIAAGLDINEIRKMYGDF